MILVADSSALIALAVCNSLNLLDLLFTEVKVPRAVFVEVSKKSKKEADSLAHYLEDKIIDVEIDRNYIIKEGTIEIGELEAMTLYKQLAANWLLIDDRRAWKIAELNQINTIGEIYSAFYDNNTPNGPFLWCYRRIGYSPNDLDIIAISLKKDSTFGRILHTKESIVFDVDIFNYHHPRSGYVYINKGFVNSQDVILVYSTGRPFVATPAAFGSAFAKQTNL